MRLKWGDIHAFIIILKARSVLSLPHCSNYVSFVTSLQISAEMTEDELTIPPVETAMSLRVFFLLSPNPEAFTATTCSPTFNLCSKNNKRRIREIIRDFPNLRGLTSKSAYFINMERAGEGRGKALLWAKNPACDLTVIFWRPFASSQRVKNLHTRPFSFINWRL